MPKPKIGNLKPAHFGKNPSAVALEAELHLPTLHTAFPSVDCNPEDREGDRGMAAIGKLNDATPFFRENIQCWGVGVLLTIPLILDNKILESFQKVYGRIPGFFGLRNSVMSLLFMTFLRVKRLEQLKEKNPSTLGALIGLDRLPETKTLRENKDDGIGSESLGTNACSYSCAYEKAGVEESIRFPLCGWSRKRVSWFG